MGAGATGGGRPVLNLSLALNYLMGGTAAWGYHLVNLLIHLCAGLVLYGILRRTFRGFDLPAAAVALLWTAHPIQTEAVTYIVQRAESLMGLFYFLTLYCFIRYGEGSRRWAVLSVLACFLGMGTKEVMVSAPLVVLFTTAPLSAARWRRPGGRGAATILAWPPAGCCSAV